MKSSLYRSFLARFWLDYVSLVQVYDKVPLRYQSSECFGLGLFVVRDIVKTVKDRIAVFAFRLTE